MENQTIAEIVAQNYQTADVFKKYEIDFCCGGKKTLEAVCAEKNLPFEKINAELNEKISLTRDMPNYNAWKLSFLIDYIVQVHHQYITDSIPVIRQYADKVTTVHGGRHPELASIRNLFYEVAAELEAHLMKEERILFPYIKQAEENNGEINAPFGSIKNPIAMMEQEHDKAGDLCHQIAVLTNQYTIPEDACNTYRVYFAKLKEFEDDLHKHVHLENNILFPKAIKLGEKEN